MTPGIDGADDGQRHRERVLQSYRDFAVRLCHLLAEAQRPDLVATVARYHQNRLIGATNSLAVLHQKSPHDFGFDGAMVLRGIYDLHLQALYILHDPAERVARADLFSEYIHIERVQLLDRYRSNNTGFAQSIVNAPEWQAGEAHARQEYARVSRNYAQNNGKMRRYWYAGTLRDLARAVGYEAEYDLLQPMLSAPVHSSPFALLTGPPLDRGMYLFDAWRLAFRVFDKVMELHGWAPENDLERLLLRTAKASLFAAIP